MKKSNKRKKPEDLMVRAGPSSDSTNSARLRGNLPNTNNVTETNVYKTDGRKQWTKEENEELMYCYYLAKAQGRGYLKRLEVMMKGKYLENRRIQKFTGNTLAAQCRYIEESNTIRKEKLQEIKRRAENTLAPQEARGDQQQVEEAEGDQQQEEEAQGDQHQEETEVEETQQEEYQNKETVSSNEDEQRELLQLFQENRIKVQATEVESRKPLPKAKINKKFITNLQLINEQIKRQLQPETCITEVDHIIYAAAVTVLEANGQKPIEESSNSQINKISSWETRLDKKLQVKRKELTKITDWLQGRNQKKKQIQYIIRKYKIIEDNKENIVLLEEQLKQKINAIAGRIRRYKDNEERKKQNLLFSENEKLFYRKYTNQQAKAEKIPKKEEIEKFWKNIIGNKSTINENPEWMKGIEKKTSKIEEPIFTEIGIGKLKAAIAKTQNWKATGVDRIHNYYIKKLTSTHANILECYNRIIMEKEDVPEWMTVGRVILLPKNEETENPKNWRPIACLPTIYKILTSVIAEEIRDHCSKNKILTDYQRGCKKGARGCQDQLLLNRYILEDANKNSKNLSMAWIDYQKAFDSIPHEWLLKIMHTYKVPVKLIAVIKKMMKNWKLQMTAYGDQKIVKTDPIEVKCGIFQGDSLSPLLFCLGLNPLSEVLQEDKQNGYQAKGGQFINHLLYMDDIKIYAKNEKNLDQLLRKVEVITKDVGMQFGLDKCKTIHLRRGKPQRTQGKGHILLSGEIMEELKPNQEYKYLGIEESGTINHKELKKTLTEEYVRRVRRY